jgi:hypothetical protein
MYKKESTREGKKGSQGRHAEGPGVEFNEFNERGARGESL